MAKSTKTGGIRVDTEHIFPVIKRWLYSDKEIFLRELVSNGCDAVTKMKRLVSLGEATAEDAWRIDVILDEQLSEIRVIDNGIGMTRDEIDRYINNIALSGALEFIEKYEGEEGEGAGIIGHFGLGFYSAFMVAKTVEIHSLSYPPYNGHVKSVHADGSVVLILKSVLKYFELKLTYGSYNYFVVLVSVNLDGSFLSQLINALLELLGLHGVLWSYQGKHFSRECWKRLEEEFTLHS